MPFLIIWLAGDLFNLVGVVLQGLLPTMVKETQLDAWEPLHHAHHNAYVSSLC